mgnify:CR=1 FL=1
MSHAHLSPAAAYRGRLLAVLLLSLGVLAAEVVGGLLTGSLALLADAGHMLTDAASLLLALGALWMAGRPATTRHTWALARVEILAALVNGLFLWLVVVWLVWEAIERFGPIFAQYYGQSEAPMVITYFAKEAHVGLTNVDHRLRAAFGNDYGLVVETAIGAGTKVVMRVPKFRSGVRASGGAFG